MARTIEHDQVQSFMKSAAQVVEVLPSKEYRRVHLPGAVNIPLAKLGRETASQLAGDRPVIVYCYDYQ